MRYSLDTAFASCAPLPSWLRHRLCLVFPLPPWLRYRLCFDLSSLKRRLFLVALHETWTILLSLAAQPNPLSPTCHLPLPSWLRHRLCLVCSTAVAAKTLPLPRVIKQFGSGSPMTSDFIISLRSWSGSGGLQLVAVAVVPTAEAVFVPTRGYSRAVCAALSDKMHGGDPACPPRPAPPPPRTPTYAAHRATRTATRRAHRVCLVSPLPTDPPRPFAFIVEENAASRALVRTPTTWTILQ